MGNILTKISNENLNILDENINKTIITIENAKESISSIDYKFLLEKDKDLFYNIKLDFYNLVKNVIEFCNNFGPEYKSFENYIQDLINKGGCEIDKEVLDNFQNIINQNNIENAYLKVTEILKSIF